MRPAQIDHDHTKEQEGAMMYAADLHIHSKYSRATSSECVPAALEMWARRKADMMRRRDVDKELGELYSEMQLDSAEAIRTPDEVQADIVACEAAAEECTAALEAAEKACLDDVKALTDEIYARLENGEAFEDLIAEYGKDPGMQGGITAENGYCVAEKSVNWEPNFRDAAMALENVGDYTMEPVVSGSGVHIIRYEADVIPGEAGIENVYDALRDEALANLQENHADEVIAGWVAEAKPEYDLEKFMKVLYG
jgi:hypothetical protein